MLITCNVTVLVVERAFIVDLANFWLKNDIKRTERDRKSQKLGASFHESRLLSLTSKFFSVATILAETLKKIVKSRPEEQIPPSQCC